MKITDERSFKRIDTNKNFAKIEMKMYSSTYNAY